LASEEKLLTAEIAEHSREIAEKANYLDFLCG
jgi:hypothetical protein